MRQSALQGRGLQAVAQEPSAQKARFYSGTSNMMQEMQGQQKVSIMSTWSPWFPCAGEARACLLALEDVYHLDCANIKAFGLKRIMMMFKRMCLLQQVWFDEKLKCDFNRCSHLSSIKLAACRTETRMARCRGM
jgi:hypothetical protein